MTCVLLRLSGKNMTQFNVCWKCRVQSVRSFLAQGYPQRAPVVVDVEQIQARQHQVLVTTEGGQE